MLQVLRRVADHRIAGGYTIVVDVDGRPGLEKFFYLDIEPLIIAAFDHFIVIPKVGAASLAFTMVIKYDLVIYRRRRIFRIGLMLKRI